MSSVARKLLQVQPSAAETVDDDFANVVLLLDGDGTSGDANNTFTDSGSVGATVTENGTCVQGSFSPYGDNWSVYFDGSGDYLQVDGQSPTVLGSGDLTVEFWINTTATGFNILNPATSTGSSFWGLIVQSGNLRWNDAYASTNLWQVAGSAILDGEWHHVAVVRNSGTFAVYYDGTAQSLQSGSFSDTTNYSGNDELRIGKGNLGDFKGHLSNLRMVNGTAVYTGAFTPPTAPFTPNQDYNEKILMCQSNRFIHTAEIDRTVTPSGTPTISNFSPFKNDDARDITTDGGSVLFGPSGDYLQLPSNSAYNATSSLCVEGWFYMVGAPGSGASAHAPFSRWASTSGGQRAWLIDIENTGVRMRVDTATNSANAVVVDDSTGALNQRAWYHIALTWDGSTYRGFLNGELIGSLADSNAPRGTSQVIRVGFNTNSHYMDGYVSDFRILVDQGPMYTNEFGVPTAPLGSMNGTAFTLDRIEYENKEFSVSSQETNPQGVRFKSDGTKMFVIGNTGDDVNEYSLSTAWDITTASFVDSFSVNSEDTVPNGLAFSTDGTKMYITGNTNNKIFQYTLSTAWDISTASYASKSMSTRSGPIEPFIHPSGTYIYNVDADHDAVDQWALSTAFDVSTASATPDSFDVGQLRRSWEGNAELIPTGIAFSSDGTKMLICGQNTDSVYQLSLSTAWDITTATDDKKYMDFTSQAVNPSGIDFSNDGSKLYMVSNNADKVYQYSLTETGTPELLMNFQDAGIYDRTGINNLDTVGNAQIDTAVKKYGTGSIEFDGTNDYLEAVYPSGLYDGFNDMDWTIEAWVYPKADSDDRGGIVELYTSDTHYIRLMYVPGSTSGNVDFQFAGNSFTIQSGNFSELAWYHVAGVSYNGTLTLYVNGTAIGSDSSYNLASVVDPRVVIGLDLVTTDRYTDGFIDDVRITKGVARYTANFTPPNAALPKF